VSRSGGSPTGSDDPSTEWPQAGKPPNAVASRYAEDAALDHIKVRL
jgi:hypothetical protein